MKNKNERHIIAYFRGCLASSYAAIYACYELWCMLKDLYSEGRIPFEPEFDMNCDRVTVSCRYDNGSNHGVNELFNYTLMTLRKAADHFGWNLIGGDDEE